MSEGKTEASIYQQAEDGKTELSLMHFAITNPQWQPPHETNHFISQLKERVQREATGAPTDTHTFTSLSQSEVWTLFFCTVGHLKLFRGVKYVWLMLFFSLSLHLPLFLSLSLAKESRCQPLGRPAHISLCSFWPGQLFDQSRCKWRWRGGVSLALPFTSQWQSSPERKLQWCSSGHWPRLSHKQTNGRLRVR